MAVQKPDARVVRFEGDGDVAGAGEEGDVAARRVFVVEFSVGEVGWVEGDDLLGKNYEVMAVEVDLWGEFVSLGALTGMGERNGGGSAYGMGHGEEFSRGDLFGDGGIGGDD